MESSYKTPILLITFNRPNHTHQIWNEIIKQKPEFLFIFQDGPRINSESDIVKCNEVRNILEENLSWECNLKTNFSEINLGCGKGPSTAISWFFKHVDQGIILEDDCLPHPDFFAYASTLLDKYRNDAQVMVIGSTNIDEKVIGDGSYYFSMQNRPFVGWATWKRAWFDFDYFLSDISPSDFKAYLKQYNLTWKEKIYWIDIFKHVKKDRFNDSSWDYQMMFAIWKNYGIGIVPNVNLTTNIGFDNEATHTFSSEHIGANRSVSSILPLRHPSNKKISREADLFFHSKYFQPYLYGFKSLIRLPYLLNTAIKQAVGKEGSWIRK